jgi:ribosome maturation factor RimP
MGFELVAVQWLPTGPSGRPTLRLSIDGPDGVDLDDTARVNQRLSLLLDEADPIPSAYDLEVSSPGIDRPVQRFVDFSRFSGFRAKITLEEGFPRRRYTGELRGTEVGGSDASPPGETVLIEVDGVVHRLPFVHIETAHLVLDLAAYARLAPPKLRKEDRETVDVEG